MTNPTRPLRLGTRASPLAMAQAHMVREALCVAHGWSHDAVMIMPVTASGDRILDRALADVGGKALWTKELDTALIDDEIDFAVHSMKDVETLRSPALTIAAVLARADVRDRLIGATTIATLAHAAQVGTSAPRRTAQLLFRRPDLKIILFRGNVATRLAKLDRGDADATLLAAAGLDRLGMAKVGHAIEIAEMLPAPAQGAIGIETRTDDLYVRGLMSAIDHAATHQCLLAERGLLAALSADCRSPVAALAQIDDNQIWLRAEIYSGDGQYRETGDVRFPIGETKAAAALGAALLSRAAPEIRACFG
jgi:hydroxymethylbilane synthase